MAFVGRRYVLVMDEFEGLVRAARTNRLFRRAPRRPSAAFTIPSTGNTYFIRGKYLQACSPIILDLLFVLFSFFFWLLCCLFFFDIRILITPLVSSNSSCKNLGFFQFCNNKKLFLLNYYLLT